MSDSNNETIKLATPEDFVRILLERRWAGWETGAWHQGYKEIFLSESDILTTYLSNAYNGIDSISFDFRKYMHLPGWRFGQEEETFDRSDAPRDRTFFARDFKSRKELLEVLQPLAQENLAKIVNGATASGMKASSDISVEDVERFTYEEKKQGTTFRAIAVNPYDTLVITARLEGSKVKYRARLEWGRHYYGRREQVLQELIAALPGVKIYKVE